MSAPAGRSKCKFHETPLVLFTALVIIGAGLPAGHFSAWALGLASWTPNRWRATCALIVLATGLLISLLHLGRPARLAYALRRTGRSPLSTEAVLTLLTVVPAGAVLFLPDRQASTLLWALVAVASPGLLLALGWVYQLPGQLSWRGTVTLSPLLLGLATGFLAQAASAQDNARLMFAAIVFLAIDAAGFALRWKVMKWDSSLGQPTYPHLFLARRRIMILRIIDVVLLPAFFILAQAPTIALSILAFGIFFDRFAFYALAVRETTEAEVARVEAVIRHHRDTAQP